MKKTQIVLRSTEDFKNRVKRAAGIDNKNASEYIRDLILEDLKKKETECK